MKLRLVLLQRVIAALNHIMDALSADPQILCYLTEGIILQNNALIYLLLSFRKQFSIKII